MMKVVDVQPYAELVITKALGHAKPSYSIVAS
jgi:hypothetical protein